MEVSQIDYVNDINLIQQQSYIILNTKYTQFSIRVHFRVILSTICIQRNLVRPEGPGAWAGASSMGESSSPGRDLALTMVREC